MRNLTENFIDFEEDRLMAMGGIRLKDGITFAKPNYPNNEHFYVMWIEAKRFHQECLNCRGGHTYRDVLKYPSEYQNTEHEMYVYRTNLSPSRAIELPHVSYSADLGFMFTNGIHRTLTWIDAGANYIPFEVDDHSYQEILATTIPVLKAMKSSDMPPLLSATSKVIDTHYITNPHLAAFMSFFPAPVPIEYEIKTWDEALVVAKYEQGCLERFLERSRALGHETFDDDAERLLNRVNALSLMHEHTKRGYQILVERGFTDILGDEEKDPRAALHKLNTDNSSEEEIVDIGRRWSEYAMQRPHPQKMIAPKGDGFDPK